MQYSEKHKEQLRQFVKEGLARVAIYFKTTLGVPEEVFFEELEKLDTLGKQMAFLENFNKEHPSTFKAMPVFMP